MKTLSRTGILALMLALPGIAAGQYYDDLYVRPSSKKVKETKAEPVPVQDEIVSSDEWDIDTYNRRYAGTEPETAQPVTASEPGIEGYYLNGFNGTQSDLEYAERIRRFHNPRFTIHITDPGYTELYYMNQYDWNIYIDGSYAYVTPTWSNPWYWNYTWAPYTYWPSWHWGGYGYGFGFGYHHYGYWGNPYWNWAWHGPHYGGWYRPAPRPPHAPNYRPQPGRPANSYGGTSSRRPNVQAPAPSQPSRSNTGAVTNRTTTTTTSQGQRVLNGNTSRSAQGQKSTTTTVAPQRSTGSNNNSSNNNSNRQTYTPSSNSNSSSGARSTISSGSSGARSSIGSGSMGGGSRSSGSSAGGGGSRSRR